MEQFIVSARKYRPQNFESVVGQQSITNTLQNAIKNNHLAQALLFCGPRGVGKTTCARILAKAVNLDDASVALSGGEDDFSFNIFELDAASNNSVDDIRNLTDQVRFAPQTGRYKIYIIDEVHMLSTNAFNAFLKTLEEPPAHALFILATTEKHKIIPTILSRVQIFDFNRISIEDIVGHLEYVAGKEGVTAEPDALHIIAQKADGAMRDALSIFDRMVSFTGNTLTYADVIEQLNMLDYDYFFKAVDHLLNQDISSSLLLFDIVLKKGFDGHLFLNGLAEHLRNLLVCRDPSTLKLLEVGDKIKDRYRDQSAKCSLGFLVPALEQVNTADIQYKNSGNQRLLVEVTLMQLCSLTSELKKKVAEKPEILRPDEAKENYSGGATHSEPSSPTLSKPAQVQAPTTNPPIESPSANTIEREAKTPEETKPNPQTTPVSTEVPNTAKPESLPSNENAKSASAEKPPEPDTTAAPKSPARTKLGRRTTLSISDMMAEQEKKEEEKPVIEESGPKGPADPFSTEQLFHYWDLYCDKLKSEQKWSMMNTLNKRRPVLGAQFKATFEVENNIQKNELEREKPELMEFLRTRLNNFQFQLETLVLEMEEVKQLYTPQEKFKHMAEKNPALLDLRQRLDLDIDF